MRHILLLAALSLGAVAAVPVHAQPAPTMTGSAASAGYLPARPPLALLRLLPPMPAAGSDDEKADAHVYRDSKRGIGGPRWQLAISQLSVTSPSFLHQISCALGAELGAGTPATMAILRRAGTDLAPAVSAAKAYYKRPRPFTTDNRGKGGGQACDPDAAMDGGKALGFAYPSGHAAVGWLWSLILSDIRPERSAPLLKFGKDTGDLRLACRVHWLSDIQGGRLLATALYQQIADRSDYHADVDKAKVELTLAPVPENCPAS